MSGKIRAVIFDLDGVLVDSEQVWDAARRQLTEDSGGRWSESTTQDMMGMSSTEWSRYMHEVLGVKMPARSTRPATYPDRSSRALATPGLHPDSIVMLQLWPYLLERRLRVSSHIYWKVIFVGH